MTETNPYESPRAIETNSNAPAETESSFDTPATGVKPLELYGVLAFGLVVFVMFSGLGGILALLIAHQHLFLAVLITCCVYVAVLIPTIVSWRRHLTEPNRWRGYGYLLGATFILAFHALFAALGMVACVLS